MLQSTNSLLAGVCMVVALASCTDSGPPCMQDADCFDNNVCHESTCIDPKAIPSSGSGGSSGASTSAASSSTTAASSGSGSGAGGSNNGCVTPPDFTEYHIDHSVTICPQTYFGTKLILKTSGISVGGKGVILDCGQSAAAISLKNIDNAHVYGFEIRNCGSYGAVTVENSSNNLLEFMKITTNQFGFMFIGAAQNHIEDVEVETEFASLMALDSPNLNIFGSKFTGGLKPGSSWHMIDINSTGAILLNDTITLLSSGTPVSGHFDKISDCTISSAGSGINVTMNGGFVGYNVITTGNNDNQSCIFIHGSGSNTIKKNTLINCPVACVDCSANGCPNDCDMHNDYYDNGHLP